MKNIKMAFFGDSITENKGDDILFTWPELVLKNLIKRGFCEKGSYHKNLGICGHTTRDANLRYQEEVLFYTWDFLIIQFGINDSDFWKSLKGNAVVSLKAFEANIIEMVQKARSFEIDRVILFTPHKLGLTRVECNNKTHNENMVPYVDTLRSIGKKMGVPVVDMWEATQGLDPKQYTFDGVHLNEKGSSLYAKHLEVKIQSLCVTENSCFA